MLFSSLASLLLVAQRDFYGGERYGAALVGRKNIWPTLILQDPDNFNTTVFFFSTQSELSILSGRAGKNVLQ